MRKKYCTLCAGKIIVRAKNTHRQPIFARAHNCPNVGIFNSGMLLSRGPKLVSTKEEAMKFVALNAMGR